MPQPRFGEINVLLDAAQDFVVDHVFISQLQDRVAFLLQAFAREAFVFGGEQTKASCGAVAFGGFQLADAVFVFDAQAFQGVGFGGIFFRNFAEAIQRRFVGGEPGFAFFMFRGNRRLPRPASESAEANSTLAPRASPG